MRGWLKADAQPLGMSLGQQVENVETFSDANEQPIYYVVYLQPSGFVVVPADDLVEPIIAFVEEGIYDPSPDNPLGALVSQDLPCRIAAVRNLQIATSGQSQKKDLLDDQQAALETASVKAQTKWAELQDYAGMVQTLELSGISDVWVAPLVQSKWSQGDDGGGHCYNYYTPCNCACGCVATAMAQLMKCHEYPIEGIGVHTFQIKVEGVPQDANTRGGDGEGGPYNWNLMDLDPGSSIPEVHRQAIGTLCYDAGVAANMKYDGCSGGGSSTSMSKAAYALETVFGYNDVRISYNVSINSMINTNLDVGHPTLLGISGNGLSHAVISDGYGYNSSTLYHHINLGWDFLSSAWYNLPYIVGTYNTIDSCVYNIIPSGSGEIISGRVTDVGENPIGDAIVSADNGSDIYDVNTTSSGIYGFTKVPLGTRFVIGVSKSGYTFVPQRVTVSEPGNMWGVNFQGVSGAHPVIWVNEEEFEFTKVRGGPDPEPQILSIWNSGFGALDWEITYDCNWLAIEPNSGSSTGETDEVTLTITDLTPGSYNCELTISAPGALNSPKTIQVNLLIGGSLRLVPSQYPTIQDAIDATLDIYGDIVIVEPNTYTGPGNRGIDFNDKPITVRSIDPNDPNIVATTIIDCQKTGRGFYFGSGTGPNSVLKGFTITNGDTIFGGGAIQCYNSSPTIANCILVDNSAGEGGGAIQCFSNSNPTIMNCMIRSNTSRGEYGIGPMDLMTANSMINGEQTFRRGGGGISCEGSNPTIINCTIINNQSTDNEGGFGGGGGVLCDNSSPVIRNCTISDNSAVEGGGIYNYNSNPTLTNSILWGNAPEEIFVYSGTPVVNYCDVQGGWSGNGNNNIAVDPCFANTSSPDANEWDYHLQSQRGRWDPNTSEWVTDANTSPCIDAGDPNSDWTGELWPHGKRINMGAYGGTPQASMSLSDLGNIADIDTNDVVDYIDLKLFTNKWLYQEILRPEDLDRNGVVNFTDFAIFANEWLWEQ